MSKAAVLGIPAAAFLASPCAEANILLTTTPGPAYTGSDPGGATGTFFRARLTGQASIWLIVDNVGMSGPNVSFRLNYTATGAGTATGVVLTGAGATLPSNTAGWAYAASYGLPDTLYLPYTVGQYYLGFRVDYAGSPAQHVWVGIDPQWLALSVTGYGAMSSVGGGSGGGNGGGAGGTGGGTPEPAGAGLALLALGAAGVMRHKRRSA